MKPTMRCRQDGTEMVFVGTTHTEIRGNTGGMGVSGNPPGPELRFDECLIHGIQVNRMSKPRTYAVKAVEVPAE